MSLTRVEAENYRQGANGTTYKDFSSGNRGGKYRTDDVDITTSTDVGGGHMLGWATEGEWLTYDVNVPTSGTYDIVFRVASGQSGRLGIALGNTNNSVDIGNTGGWDSWTNVTLSGVDLSAGAQNMRLDILSGLYLLNYVDLIPVGNTNTTVPDAGSPAPVVPSPVAPPSTVAAAVRIEAEDYIEGANGVTYNDFSSGNRGGKYRTGDVDITTSTDVGGGYMLGWATEGEWLTYSANLPQSGTYDITLRVASGMDGNSLGLSFGGNQSTVAINNTGGWDSWTDVTISGVTLNAGPQDLRLDILKGLYLVNYIDIVTTGASNPDPGNTGGGTTGGVTPTDPVTTNPSNGAAAIRIQAEDYKEGANGVTYNDFSSGNRGGKYRNGDVDITTSTDVGGGYMLGWATEGEWLTYDVNVPTSGTYDIVVRVASGQSGNLGLSFGGNQSTVTINNTGGWDSWTDVTISNVNLNAGAQNMRLDILSGLYLVNHIDIVPAGSGSSGGSGNNGGSGGGSGGGTVTPPNDVLRIMALGDSNTAGRSDRGSYRKPLQNLLSSNGFDFDFVGSASGGASAPDRNHEGHAGSTISDISNSINGWLNAAPNLDYVLLMLGTNDILEDLSLNQAPNRIGKLIDKITSKAPQTRVLVSSIVPSFANSNDLGQVNAFNSALANVVRSKARKGKKVGFVDAANGISQSDLVGDKIHLNQGGSNKIAKALYNGIARDYSAAALSSAGSRDLNNITGNDNNNTLTGTSGDDFINGLKGDDLLTGGGGRDTFVVARGQGSDFISDFTIGQDLLGLANGLITSQLTLSQGTGANASDTFIFYNNEQLVGLSGIRMNTLNENSFTQV